MKFVRIFSGDLIPKILVEDNKDRNYSVEDFFSMIDSYLVSINGKPNDTEQLYLIVDDVENIIVGYLWYSINMLEKEIYLNTISILKERRDTGKVLDWAFEELQKAFKKINGGLKCVRTCSTRQEWHKKRGFVPSKNVLLEYDLTEGEDNGKN